MALEHIVSAAGPWLHPFVASESAAWDFLVSLSSMEKPRVIGRRVRGNKARTVQGWFDECSASWQFPYYFGENWNAFDECLTDLEWLPADAYILLVTNSPLLLEVEPPEELTTLLTILESAGREWSQEITGQFPRQPRAFHVLMQCERTEEQALSQKLDGAKVSWSPFSQR